LVTRSKLNQTSSGNLSNITCEVSRHFRNKKKEYLKAELETNIKTISETSVGASMTLRRVTSL
jgi:hypothetical protein